MFDTILVIAIFLFMWKGYQRRFKRELPRLLALFGAVLFGLIFYEVIGLLMNVTPVPSLIGDLTTDSFIKKVSGTEVGNGTVNRIFATLPHEDNKKLIVGEFVVKFLAFILLLVVTYIVLRKIFRKLKFFQKINIMKQLGPAFGGLVGLLRGVICVYVAIGFLVVLEPLIPTEVIREQVENSEMVRFIYEENYVANIVARRDFLSSDY